MTEIKEKGIELKLNSNVNLQIVNIVAVISFKQIDTINLVTLLEKVESIKYNPEVFPGAILKIEKPKATFLIFSTGKMIISGVKSILIIPKATQIVLHKLEKIGIKFSKPIIKIVNMIGTAKFSNFLNLDTIVLYLGNCQYDPTIFPAIIYHMRDPKASFLLFSTGKIICTGATNKKTVLLAISKLKKLLNQLEVNILDPNAVTYEEPFFI